METNSYVQIHGKNISHNSPLSTVPSMSIEKLFPALLECFGIILCGYIAGRADIITANQAKGLGNFVSKFALPALLFKNMVLLDFGDVIWAFLWSVLVAKVTVFVLVCVLTLLVASPESRYSKAGLYAIFATQSNDFALGYPIVDALYRNTYPEYLQYIYLVAPVSLMFLNPIGFALCEVQKWRDNRQSQHSSLSIVGVVVLQVLKNPIVFMVVVGIASHFALGQRIPAMLGEFVDGLANSFGGAALFYLGLSMVGQLRKLTRDTGVALILLITAKLLLMPLITKDMVDLLDVSGGNSSTLNHTSLSNFAFLYGVFPTAPSVAIYASQYSMELEVVTSGMVISTFLSAPIMYVSAWLLTIPLMDPAPLVAELQNVSFNVSIVSLIALVWTMAVMLLSKKFKRLPHMFAMNLFLAQFLVCVSMILWNFVVCQDNVLGQTLTFTMLYGSLYSTYFWTGLIPVCLALTTRDDLLRLRPVVFMILGWGIPFLLAGGLLIFGDRMTDMIDSAFFYGRAQMSCTTVVLAVSLVVASVSLMGLSQGGREQRDYQALDRASVTATTEELRTPGGLEDFTPPDGEFHSCPPVQPMPDMIVSTQRDDTNTAGLSEALSDPQQQSSPPSEPQPTNQNQPDERQLVRHVLLCLLLTVSLIANLSSCLWWLFNKDPGRLYLELQFFCAVANYGQGFISFGIFGLDRHLILLPFKKRLRGLFQGGEGEEGESPSTVPEEIRLTCTQFVRYHKNQCVQDIVQTRRYGGEEGPTQNHLAQSVHPGVETPLAQSDPCLQNPVLTRARPQTQNQERPRVQTQDQRVQVQTQRQARLHPRDPNPEQNQNPDPTRASPKAQTRGLWIPDPGDRRVHNPLPGPSEAESEACFWGSDLVEWLVLSGLAGDRREARSYRARLQQGGVIQPHLAPRPSLRAEASALYCFTQERGSRPGAEEKREGPGGWS